MRNTSSVFVTRISGSELFVVDEAEEFLKGEIVDMQDAAEGFQRDICFSFFDSLVLNFRKVVSLRKRLDGRITFLHAQLRKAAPNIGQNIPECFISSHNLPLVLLATIGMVFRRNTKK